MCVLFSLIEGTERPTKSVSFGHQIFVENTSWKHPFYSNELKEQCLMKERTVLKSSEGHQQDSF